MVDRQLSEPIVIGPGRERVPVIGPAQMAFITITPGTPRPVIVSPEENHPVITIAPQVARVIEPEPRGAWDEFGWTVRRQGGVPIYEGEYRVRDRLGHERRFTGRIEERQNESVAFIADPPDEIRNHRHHSCLQLYHLPDQGERTWYLLHWRIPARDPDTALLYMEMMLDESINRNHRR